jgi:hypothetical protein
VTSVTALAVSPLPTKLFITLLKAVCVNETNAFAGSTRLYLAAVIDRYFPARDA